MKIGIDISQIVFEGTGVATYTRNLVRELLRINSGGHNDYVLFGASLRRKPILDLFAKDLQKEGLKFTSSFWLLPPTLMAEVWNEVHHVKVEKLIGKIDVFHSSDWSQPPSRAKKITTVHDLVVYKYPESSQGKLGFRLEKLAPLANIVAVQKQRLAWVKKECDLIIADSQATKKDLIDLLAIPKEKIGVIYLAAGEEYWQYNSLKENERARKIISVKSKYHLEDDYLLAVGTQEPRKNFARLLEAFKTIDRSKVTLAIAGKYGWGEQNSKVEDNNIKQLGYVPQEDLPALYAGAKVFVFPSLYEGFGVPILEAMTVGCPVITSNIGSMPEAGGEAAIYVQPDNVNSIADGINKILKLTSKEYAQLSARSKIQAKKFSWENTATETLGLYESLVK